MTFRRTLCIGLSAVSLAATLVACPNSSPKQPSAAPKNFVPWVDTLPPPRSPEPTPSRVPAGTPPCRASMIRVGRFGLGGAAAGTYYTSASVRNVASETCYIDRRTSVRFVDEKGREVQARNVVGLEPDTGFVVPTEEDLERGTTAAYRVTIRLGVGNVCPPPPATTMEIRFAPGGTRRDASIPRDLGTDDLPPECATEMRSGYVATFVSSAPPEPEPTPSPLTATIIAPGPAHAGSRFRYFVRITNPTSTDYPLVPCPIYSEASKTTGDFGTYLLNCVTARAIPAMSSLTFEMVLSIASTSLAERDGRILLTWGFDGGAGPSANAWVRLIEASSAAR